MEDEFTKVEWFQFISVVVILAIIWSGISIFTAKQFGWLYSEETLVTETIKGTGVTFWYGNYSHYTSSADFCVPFRVGDVVNIKSDEPLEKISYTGCLGHKECLEFSNAQDLPKTINISRGKDFKVDSIDCLNGTIKVDKHYYADIVKTQINKVDTHDFTAE